MSGEDPLLLTAEVAKLAGVAERTITMRLYASRRKAAAAGWDQNPNEALSPRDLPIPDPADDIQFTMPQGTTATTRMAPRWHKSVIDAWLPNRRGDRRRKGPARRRPKPVGAAARKQAG